LGIASGTELRQAFQREQLHTNLGAAACKPFSREGKIAYARATKSLVLRAAVAE
jgi:hypothetical protein